MFFSILFAHSEKSKENDVENDVDLQDFAFIGEDIETEEIRDPDNPDGLVQFDDIIPEQNDDKIDDFYTAEHF